MACRRPGRPSWPAWLVGPAYLTGRLGLSALPTRLACSTCRSGLSGGPARSVGLPDWPARPVGPAGPVGPLGLLGPSYLTGRLARQARLAYRPGSPSRQPTWLACPACRPGLPSCPDRLVGPAYLVGRFGLSVLSWLAGSARLAHSACQPRPSRLTGSATRPTWPAGSACRPGLPSWPARLVGPGLPGRPARLTDRPT